MSVELLPTRPGQPLTMTVATDDPDCGHWYSPAFVRAAVNAALERAAQLVIELTEDRGTADAIRALQTNKEQGNE